ncbi:MAG TPA: hypothetical protein VJ598_10705 [Albitalea sp.]|nr:hypothetical protein [Albitalea sp.]
MDDDKGYWKLGEIEQRFNETQTGVRTLASAWILGALAALGWLLDPTKPSANWPVPFGLLALVVCMLATAGIATLWVMDQLVFHRLLDSVFLVGLRMEFASPELPPLRHVMLKTMEGQGTHRWERLFYLAPLLVFTLLSGVVLFGGSASWLASPNAALNAVVRPIGALMLVLQVAVVAWVLLKQPATRLTDRAGWFGDPAFEAALRERRSADVIARSRATSSEL